MATPTKSGPEFLVNTNTAGNHLFSVTAGLIDGRFVVAWADTSHVGADKDGSALRGQIFNADGTKAGGEFEINTDPSGFAGDQILHSIIPLADGNFMVAWDDNSGFGGDSYYGSVGRIFHADGTPSGAAFLLNTTTVGYQSHPSLTQLADGHIVATWDDSSVSPIPGGNGINAQMFNPDGSKFGNQFSPAISSAYGPTVTALDGGGFVLAWSDFNKTLGDNDSFGIHARMFNADGSQAGSEFLVNTTTANSQVVPHLAALIGGGFVATYLDQSHSADDPSGTALRGQIFDANGAKVGAEFLVNSSTNGGQDTADVAALHDGRFVVAWTDHGQNPGDTSLEAIRAQVFNADGSKSGGEFLVNTTTADSQFDPHIGVLADGRFTISWTDHSQSPDDPSGYAVRMQIFDPGKIATSDFNSDGHSDILWQNTDGTIAEWFMNGTSLTAGANVALNPGSMWHAIGSGDFNGDGKADILWQNADGTPAVWLMNGLNVLSGANVGANPGADWHVIGAGDFNGDGKADILWQNADGTPAVWLMNGTNLIGGADVGVNPGPSWHVIGAGDFNGDGKADILWQNADGTPAVWLMNGTNLLAGSNVGFNPGADWHVVGTGDFNGDGKADILWQNKDGTPAVWLMNGTNLLAGANVGFNPGPSWHVIGTGDYNGDGKADIEWQNTDGTAAVWLMDGTNVLSGANVGADPGANWHVIPQHHDLV